MAEREKVIHLRDTWAGVKMGFTVCGTHVEPFAKNIRSYINTVTCKKCLKKGWRIVREKSRKDCKDE